MNALTGIAANFNVHQALSLGRGSWLFKLLTSYFPYTHKSVMASPGRACAKLQALSVGSLGALRV